MATNHTRDTGNENNPSVGYDKTDLSARGILIFFLVLAIFGVAIQFGVLGLWVSMSKIADKHDPEMSPLAPTVVTPRAEIMQNTANVNIQKFPEPRLQDDDTREMTRLLSKETEALTAEPWQDAQGNMHLPIDQAIKMVGTRLPIREGITTALPNYPGTPFADPSASVDAATKQDEGIHGEAENPPPAK